MYTRKTACNSQRVVSDKQWDLLSAGKRAFPGSQRSVINLPASHLLGSCVTRTRTLSAVGIRPTVQRRHTVLLCSALGLGIVKNGLGYVTAHGLFGVRLRHP